MLKLRNTCDLWVIYIWINSVYVYIEVVTTSEHIYDTEVLHYRMQGVKSYSINLKKTFKKIPKIINST